MKKRLMDRLNKEWLFCDGGTGTVLQSMGLKGGELPETWNLLHPDRIERLYEGYLRAGCDIFNANTFGANRLKYPDGDDLERIVTAAVDIAKKARAAAGREDDAYIALDIGPTGKLIEPMGDLAFERAVELFAEVVRIGAAAGADLVLIETMTDSYEAKAAVLAAKENCSLPVFVTTTYDEKGKMLTGGSVDSTVALLEGLGVDALGVNCSLGPKEMIPIVKRITEVASIPVVVNPNAGLPRTENGQTVYDIGPEQFVSYMEEIADLGVQVLGGCCGTTPDYIRLLAKTIKKKPFRACTVKNRTVVTSFSQSVVIGEHPAIVGERINPTGKKKLKKALEEGDLDYIANLALEEEEAGADILDVNVGIPDIDEPDMMEKVVRRLQEVTSVPLQIDTTNPEALERALRIYNGKAMVNSVNGKEEQIRTVMPIVRKYGGVLTGLCIDEAGIPQTPEGRVKVAEKIIDAAVGYGIQKKDLVIDGLAMTVSSDQESAKVALETVHQVRHGLGVNTILGVSNISFGLPQRNLLNMAFFTMAMQCGLSCAIINPNNEGMMAAWSSFMALTGTDAQCMHYIERYGNRDVLITGSGKKAKPALGADGLAADGKYDSGAAAAQGSTGGAAGAASGSRASGSGAGAAGNAASGPDSLSYCIRKGLKAPAAQITQKKIAAGEDPMDIINEELIPALNVVGDGFEKGTLFLPQLLMAAEASQSAFAVIRESMAGKPRKIRGRIILATVKGDIHDIGKNIVKVLLENYGYDVIDLGRDVPPETIVDTAVKEDIKLVGLSALMTTTVVSMEETIRLLREKKPDCRVVVGGAVMTQEYADKIGADAYGKDAMATVRYADSVFGEG